MNAQETRQYDLNVAAGQILNASQNFSFWHKYPVLQQDRLEMVNMLNATIKAAQTYLDLIDPPEIITQERLKDLGFQRIHMNPKWGGGWMRWIKDLPNVFEGSIVVTFGCHYCLEAGADFIVWFSVGDFVKTDVALSHIKTVDQLTQNLWLAVSGSELKGE